MLLHMDPFELSLFEWKCPKCGADATCCSLGDPQYWFPAYRQVGVTFPCLCMHMCKEINDEREYHSEVLRLL